MTIRVNDFLRNISVLLILIYVYFRTILQSLIGKNANYIMVGLMVILWLVALRNLSLIDVRISLLWILFLLLILFDRHSYNYKTISYTTIVTAGGIISSLILAYQKNLKMHISFIKYSCLLLKIHVIATLFFSLFPRVYKESIVKLFSGTTRKEVLSQVDRGDVPGLTGHYSFNGIYLAIAVILFACICFANGYRSKKRDRIWMALSILALLLTGKRAHFVFAIFSIYTVFLFFAKEKVQSRLVKAFFAVICVAVFFVIAVNYIPFLSITFNRIISLFGSNDKTNGRLYFYRFAIQWFKESPIFGLGWEEFKIRLNQTDGPYLGLYDYMSAHNVYLQVLCEFGVIGLILFISKLAQDLSWGIKYERRSDNDDLFNLVVMIAMAMHIFFILYCFTGNPLYDVEFFFPYMISMSMLYYIVRVKGSK